MTLISKIKRRIKKVIYPLYGEILMLHRVVKTRSILEENRILEITPEFLEQTILKYKSDRYRFVSMDEVRMLLKKPINLTNKFVCFTLDDGFADNYEEAYPIFKKHNCPFTIYITTDYPDKNKQYWWYHLEDLLHKKYNFSLNGIEYDCSDITKQNRAFIEIRNKIFSSDASVTIITLEKLFEENGCNSKVHSLCWEQIIELSKEPLCTIGAHSVTHSSLPILSDEKIIKELLLGKEKIEAKTGMPVNHFAYPYGNWDNRVKNLVMQHFRTAVTVNWGMIKKYDNLFTLNRKPLEEN